MRMRPSHDIQVGQAVRVVAEKEGSEANRLVESRREELAELPLLGRTIRRSFHGSEEKGRRVRWVERSGVRRKRKGMPARSAIAPT